MPVSGGKSTVEERRAGRKKRRASPAPRAAAATAPTSADAASVSPATRKIYQAAYDAFLTWADDSGIARAHKLPPADLDSALVKYLDEALFRTGEDAGAARSAIFGTIFCRSLAKGALSLPRCRRALAGFLKDEPPTSEDPCPVEAAAVLAEWLLSRKALLPKLAGLAFLTSFDLFTRPTETLEMKPEDVVTPGVGQYRSTAVVIAPSNTGRTGAAPRRAAKSGEFDDTVIAGLKGMKLEFVASILKELKRITPIGTTLFSPLTLAKYGSMIAKAVAGTGLTKLRITPHSARHGGASTASLLKILKVKELQRRGRWLAPKSVRRYEKSGKLPVC